MDNKPTKRSSDAYMNFSLEQMEAIWEKGTEGAKPFLKQSHKESKGIHKEYGTRFEGGSYNSLKTYQWLEENFLEGSTDYVQLQGFIYLVRFAKGYYYIGQTEDLHKRMTSHRAGWKQKLKKSVNKHATPELPDGFKLPEQKIANKMLFAAVKQCLYENGEISGNIKKLSESIRQGKVSWEQVTWALKEVTTNGVAVLDIVIEDNGYTLDESERYWIGLLNSMEYKLLNKNFSDYSVIEAIDYSSSMLKGMEQRLEEFEQGIARRR